MVRYHMLTSRIIQDSVQSARSLGHSCVGAEHIFLAMLQCPGGAGQLLRGLGLEPGFAMTMTAVLRGVGTADLPLAQGLDPDAKRLLRQAAREARAQNKREIGPEHLLLAMTRQAYGTIREIMEWNGLHADEVFTRTVEWMRWEAALPAKGKKEAADTKLLEQFSEDLVQKASNMDPVIGREREIDMVVGILCRKSKKLNRRSNHKR